MANEAVAAATPTGTLPLGPEADGAVVALAAAARCRRLLKSVVVLTEVGLHDVTGVLLRSICETLACRHVRRLRRPAGDWPSPGAGS